DINELDFDDPIMNDLVIGGKVKVLIQDLNIEKLRSYLSADREIIVSLLRKCEAINGDRDAKLQDLKTMMIDKINSPLNPGNKKVIVFSAFSDTVKYLYEQCAPYFLAEYCLKSALVTGSDENKTNLTGCRWVLDSLLSASRPSPDPGRNYSPKLPMKSICCFAPSVFPKATTYRTATTS